MRRSILALVVLVAFIPSITMADSPGPSLNPFRAYPPSCLADPLPQTPSGPMWTASVTLTAVVLATFQTTTENVTFTFWRTPCGQGSSALLGLYQRSAQNEGRFDVVPLFPEILLTQGTMQYFARLPIEPNTVRSGILPLTPLAVSGSFVFENFSTSAAPQFNFSNTLNLAIHGTNTVSGDVPAYDPNQYTAAFLPLPIAGYMTGNWYDPNHSGEGIQTEVLELGAPGTANNRFITVAWYTYDSTGTPYWLFASGVFTAGDRTVALQVAYETGGGFAGNFGASAHAALWGNMAVQFPDCNRMQFTYQSTSGLSPAIPQGSGSKTWTRLTQMNGLACQ